MDMYSVVCQWSDEDEGYIALVPELKGLSAFGETPAEAINELEIAKKLYLQVYEDDGCQLPEPKKLQEFSGQLRVRMPKSLHEDLSREAEREGVSLNTYIVNLLSSQNKIDKIQKDFDTVKNLVFDKVLTGGYYSGLSSSSQASTLSTKNIDERYHSCNIGETNH